MRYMCVCVTYVWEPCRGQKVALDPQALKLLTDVESPDVEAGDQMLVLWKNRKCS